MHTRRDLRRFCRGEAFFVVTEGRREIGFFDSFGSHWYAEPEGFHRLHQRLGLPFHHNKRVRTGADAARHIRQQQASPWWSYDRPARKPAWHGAVGCW